MQKGKGQVIKEHAYRSCHDMNIVRNMPEEVSQTAQRHARKDKDNVGYLVTYLRLLHVFSTNKYNAQISWYQRCMALYDNQLVIFLSVITICLP